MLPLITSTVKIHGRRLLLLIAAISITSSAWANGLPTANPESVGVSSERLGRLSESMQRYVDSNQLAGTVSLIARKGKVIHLESQAGKARKIKRKCRTTQSSSLCP